MKETFEEQITYAIDHGFTVSFERIAGHNMEITLKWGNWYLKRAVDLPKSIYNGSLKTTLEDMTNEFSASITTSAYADSNSSAGNKSILEQ